VTTLFVPASRSVIFALPLVFLFAQELIHVLFKRFDIFVVVWAFYVARSIMVVRGMRAHAVAVDVHVLGAAAVLRMDMSQGMPNVWMFNVAGRPFGVKCAVAVVVKLGAGLITAGWAVCACAIGVMRWSGRFG
jgi:hypothetical protein